MPVINKMDFTIFFFQLVLLTPQIWEEAHNSNWILFERNTILFETIIVFKNLVAWCQQVSLQMYA